MSVDDELIPGQGIHEVVSTHPAWGKTQRKQRVKDKPIATLTLIDSARFGAMLIGTLDGPVEHIHNLSRAMGITRRHIAERGCRGPRPSEP